MRVAFSRIRLKDASWGCPYLSYDKCRNVVDYHWFKDRIKPGSRRNKENQRTRISYDNGRILAAEYLETTITDVDLRIIMEEYEWENVQIIKAAYSTYGKLPGQYLEPILDYYVKKTTLKGLEEFFNLYNKSKAKLNAVFGMSVQNPGKQSILFKDMDHVSELDFDPFQTDDYVIDESKSLEERIDKAYKNAFSSFAWGVWVTAWGRFHLEEGVRAAHEQGGFVYCDTDSVKYVGNVDFERINQRRRMNSKRNGAFATDPKGKVHYMLEFEDDGEYQEFITLGAKKYAYTDEKGKLHLTCAGVNKKKGAEELEAAGGISKFREGFKFIKAGGTEAVYNDHPKLDPIMIDGHELRITRNVVIQDSTYTVGATDEYFRILQYPKLWLTVFTGNDNIELPESADSAGN